MRGLNPLPGRPIRRMLHFSLVMGVVLRPRRVRPKPQRPFATPGSTPGPILGPASRPIARHAQNDLYGTLPCATRESRLLCSLDTMNNTSDQHRDQYQYQRLFH